MILFRCVATEPEADEREAGGPLWFPRPFQSDGRHDNPHLYGCLYVGEVEVSVVVEQLARFRNEPRLTRAMLRRGRRPLRLVALDLPEDVQLIDLDEPTTLASEQLRPSLVATRDRASTQTYAAALFTRHPRAGGMRWWSTLESSWINLTLFDRVARRLRLREQRELTVFDPVVRAAADFLGLG